MSLPWILTDHILETKEPSMMESVCLLLLTLFVNFFAASALTLMILFADYLSSDYICCRKTVNVFDCFDTVAAKVYYCSLM